MARTVQTPIGILSFPVLFSPRPRAEGGEPCYQCSLLFDKNAQADPKWADLRAAVAEVIDEEWGQGKSRDREFIQTLRLPFRACAEKQYKGYNIPGGLFISPWTKSRPGIVDARRQEIILAEEVWAGQHARASVKPFAYNRSGNRGVNFGLNNVQICRTDGERLDGRRAASEDFDDYSGPGAPALTDDDTPF